MKKQHSTQSAVAQDRKTRAAYAKMVTRLFTHWQLADDDQLTLLGLYKDSRATLESYRNGKPLANSRDLQERVAYLFDIHAQLRVIFPHNRNLAYGWMTARVADFTNRTPIEVVKQHGLVGLNMLHTYLNKEDLSARPQRHG